MGSALFASLYNAGFDSFLEPLALEFSRNRQHARQCPAG